jgi:hypothetical protein
MSRWPCERVSASRTTSPNAAGFDTDGLSARLAAWAELLGDGPWTNRFPFRPTFEPVARHLYSELVPGTPGLVFVELEDRTYGSRTRYLPAA